MRLLRPLTAPVRAALAWWRGLTPTERVIYRTSALFALGFGLIHPPLAFIAPGLFWALLLVRRTA
jgi:hypothetical protein